MPTVHNKSKSRITYPIVWDEDGHPAVDEKTGVVKSEDILPGQHKFVSDEVFNHLKANVPHLIVNIDDITDLQSNIGGVAAGYVSPAEVERIRTEAFEAGVKSVTAQNKVAAESAIIDENADAELIATIDAMDRASLIAFAETNELNIDPSKLKHPDALKKAVLKAYKSTVQKTVEAA